MELMEGLTVLSTDTTAIDCPWLAIVLGILCIVLGTVMVVFAIMLFVNGEPTGVLALILSFGMFVLGIFVFHAVSKPAQTIYKVTIDESVSMVEFYERYEILDQEGLIFTITEKDAS